MGERANLPTNPGAGGDAAVRIGKWRVDPALDEISSERETVRLEPLAMRLLLCLARHAGRPVALQQLLDEVWTGVVVAQGSVYQAIAQLRRNLGDDSEHPAYIETVPRKGYRLVAPVSPWTTGSTQSPRPSENAPENPSLQPTEPARGLHRSSGGRTGARLLIIAGIAIIAAVVAALTWFARSPRTRADPPTAFTPPEKSIAVLPFVDMSEKQDQEYFADGMAEDVIDLLAKVPGLRVIGRTSSFQFRGRSLDARTIGEALQVAYVLEGSIRRSADRVRVTAQLLSARDGAHRWSDTYDAKFDDVLKVQDAIASDLARSLDVAVGMMSAAETRREAPEAYDLFMQGRQALDTFSKEGCQKAIGLFTRVLQLEPTSTRALAHLARTYEILGEENWMPPAQAFGQAREFAQRALEVDPNTPFAHVVLAGIHLIYDWDWSAAEKEVAWAFRLGQRDALALDVAAQIAGTQRQWSRAEQFAREALAQDPLDPEAHIVLGYMIYARQGREAEAEAPLRRALQIRPTFGGARYFLAISLLMQGRLQDALTETQRELPEDGKYQASSEVLYAMHRKAESDDALKNAIKESAAEWPVSIAKVYAYRGERDLAMAWLERAYQTRDPDLYSSKGDPQFSSLEGDPRYEAIFRRMKLPE